MLRNVSAESTSIDLGGGITVPGSAVSSAASSFAENPSAETAANAAMYAMCSVATGGAGAVTICGFFTVANILAAGDWFVHNVLGPLGLEAKGVMQCTFYDYQVLNAAQGSLLALETALVKSWYATRQAMGLPYQPDPNSIPYYEVPICHPNGQYWNCGVTYCAGVDCYKDPANLPAGNQVDAHRKPTQIGFEHMGLRNILATDPTWNGNQSADWIQGRKIQLVPGQLAYTIIGGNPSNDCAAYIPSFNATLGALLGTYRLGAAKDAAHKYVQQMAKRLDAEHAAIAPSSSALPTLAVLGGLTGLALLIWQPWKRS